MTNRDTTTSGVDLLTTAAERHGSDSDTTDHQIGDLEQMLRAAWSIMTTDQRAALLAQDEVESALEWL